MSKSNIPAGCTYLCVCLWIYHHLQLFHFLCLVYGAYSFTLFYSKSNIPWNMVGVKVSKKIKKGCLRWLHTYKYNVYLCVSDVCIVVCDYLVVVVVRAHVNSRLPSFIMSETRESYMTVNPTGWLGEPLSLAKARKARQKTQNSSCSTRTTELEFCVKKMMIRNISHIYIYIYTLIFRSKSQQLNAKW